MYNFKLDIFSNECPLINYIVHTNMIHNKCGTRKSINTFFLNRDKRRML